MTADHRWRVMHTDAHAVVHARGDADAALRIAEESSRRIEATFSRFVPESELSRLNASAGRWVAVSSEVSEVLELAYGLHDRTGGLFDPAILADLERSGYDQSFERLAGRLVTPRAAARRRGDAFADLELGSGRARLPAGLRIDLGGIVKGWAADRIADGLAAEGPCLVDLGGDIAVRGTPAEGAWEVAIGLPGPSERSAGVARLVAGGVATSGIDARRWRTPRGWAHHLIDPRTGEPADTDLLQVTAFAPSTAIAEVWAKAILIAGRAGAERLAAADPEIGSILVGADGALVATPGVPLVYGPPVAA